MLSNKIKKFLCRTGASKDGKLKVPANIVVFWTFLCIVIIGVIVSLIYFLITEPFKTLVILALIGGAFAILFLIAKFIDLTCDKVVFPEEVKSIYAQIEALNKDNLNYFFKGIRPLCRKL